MLAVGFSATGLVMAGDSEGHVTFWNVKEPNKMTRSLRNAHDGGVFCMLTLCDDILITGGKDGKIVEWSSEPLLERRRHLSLPDVSGSCRFIAPLNGTGSSSSSMLLVGTTRNSIYQVWTKR